MDRYQSTIRRPVTLSGIGLHSGRSVKLEIHPAKANHGIVFQRTDSPSAAPVAALARNITCTALSTTIGEGDSRVATIEHLMAALAGLGIDNALVKIDGPEVPILDGSSAPFVDKLLEAGIAKLDAFRRLFVVRETVEVRDGDRVMRVEPAKRLEFSCTIDYGSSVIGRQELDFVFSRSAFLSLSESRTFCHLNEVNAMRSRGLALGGSLENAVVVTDEKVVNEEGLRSNDEFVRHKILDCIGDLALLGAPLVGRVVLNKPGHALHAALMLALLERRSECLTVVELGGQAHDGKPAVSDAVAAMAAAAAIYG